MVYESLEVEKRLEQEKISTSVVNMHTIKPIDKQAIINAQKSKMIVTIEEHNIIGGLGSAVSEILVRNINRPLQFFLGVKDTYKNTGSYRDILQKSGISSELIYKKVIKEANKL